MNRLVGVGVGSSSGSLPAAVVPSASSLLKPIIRSMSAFKQVSHVIFDMDGLLLDTEPLYSEIFQKIIEPYGKTYTWEVKQKLMGRQSEETARIMVSEYDLPMTWQEFAEQSKAQGQLVMTSAQLMPDTEHIYENMVGDIARSFGIPYRYDVRMRILGTTETMTAKIAVNELRLPISTDEFKVRFSDLGRQRLGDVGLLKGAERLIRHLHATKVPFALATSSSQEMAELKMTNHLELFSLFHHKVYGTTDPEVIVGKPAPDIFLVAGRRFPDKPDPSKCLVFEDAPNGVRAATLAGMQSVMVPDEHVAEDLRTEATLVLKSLIQFNPEQFGLPAFANSVGLKNGSNGH